MTEQADREYYKCQQVDPEDQLQFSETLDDENLTDVLDEGYSPRDREPHDHTGPARNLDEWLAMEEPDIGIDGAGASAEEVAMHVIEDEDDWT